MTRGAVPTHHLLTVVIVSLLLLPTAARAKPATPISHTDPANIVRADVAAQNTQDWDAYLQLRSDLPGAPESVTSYKALWAQNETGIRGNVLTAHLDSLQPIPLDLAREAVDTCCYTASKLRAFYAIINYSVRTPDSYVTNGANARLYILAMDDDEWKIVQVSEPLLQPIIDHGYATGNAAERDLLDQQLERLRNIPEKDVPASASRVHAETTQPYPSTIRVGHFSDYPACVFQGTVTTPSFTSYIRDVLPNEWWPATNFSVEALKAGALAVKAVGWHRKAVHFYPNLNVDVADNRCTQAYKLGSATPRTDAAFCALTGVAFQKADGLLFYPFFKAGTYGNTGQHLGTVYQNGTQYLADHGYAYADILRYYYDYSSSTSGQAIQFFTYQDTGSACTSTPPTTTPTGLTPNNVSIQGSPIHLAWSNVSGAQSYNVNVLSWNGSAWVKAASGTVPTASANLTINQAGWYAWQVQAANTAGSGPWSSFATIYAKP